jgi:hypothetical protein
MQMMMLDRVTISQFIMNFKLINHGAQYLHNNLSQKNSVAVWTSTIQYFGKKCSFRHLNFIFCLSNFSI